MSNLGWVDEVHQDTNKGFVTAWATENTKRSSFHWHCTATATHYEKAFNYLKRAMASSKENNPSVKHSIRYDHMVGNTMLC